MSNDYTTIEKFRKRIRVGDDVDSNADSIIALFIPVASRRVDQMANRLPGGFAVPTDEAATVRYFNSYGGRDVWIDECLSISSLLTSTDDWNSYDTWTTNDYWKSSGTQIDRTPYRRLIMNENGSYIFPAKDRGVKVTAVWGYAYAATGGGSSLPEIEEATFQITKFLWKLPEENERPLVTADGIVLPSKLNVIVESLIEPYKKLVTYG